MGKLILAIIVFIIGFCSIKRPWLGIVTYYLLALLGPQYIWWWIFGDLRVTLIIAICTILGLIYKYLRKELDFEFLKNKLNFWLFLLWVSLDISYLFGPYVDHFSRGGLSPIQLFSMTNNIYCFYFVAILVVNDLKGLRYLGLIFVITTLYMVYWANTQYFTANWSMFEQGRLTGPRDVLGGAIYRDENTLALLFVTGIPFLFYFAFELLQRWQRYLLLCVIPLGWHAIFLTGSRGGLLGLGVVTVLLALKSKSNNKRLLIPLLLASFVLAFQFQGGNTMKERSEKISGYEGDKSAENRLTAWEGGLNMVMAHPVTGVGLGSFVTALPDFIESRHMVAHNTFVQFSAESGVIAGLAYLMIVWTFIKNSLLINAFCRDSSDSQEILQIERYNNASTVSFIGLIVCSLFLSLNNYEIFFFLLIFNNVLAQLCLKDTNIQSESFYT